MVGDESVWVKVSREYDPVTEPAKPTKRTRCWGRSPGPRRFKSGRPWCV